MISTRVKAIIPKMTIRQKAQIICLENRDRKINHTEPTVTDEEVEYIQSTITDYEIDEYNKWVGFYNMYKDIAPLFGLCYTEYTAEANKVLGFLEKWEAYEQEENHLNSILETFKRSENKKALDIFRESLKCLSYKFADLKTDEQGYLEIDVRGQHQLYSHIVSELDTVKDSLSILKSFIIVLEDYTNKHKSSSMMPLTLKKALKDAKTDYSLKVAPQYSKKLLDERKAKGERTSKDEEYKAVFPYYEETEANPIYLELWAERIKEVAYED